MPWRAVVAASVAAVGAGCATVGGSFDAEKLSQLEQGVTTEAQAVSLLGPPAMRTVASDGSVTLGYYYATASVSPAMAIPLIGPLVADTKSTGHSATLTFGADGRLASFSSSTTSHRIGPIGTVTPAN